MNNANPPEITPELLQENPVLAVCLTLFSFYVLAFIAGILLSWVLIGTRAYQGLPLLTVERWSPRVWGLADVVVGFVTLIATQILFVNLAVRVLGLDTEQLKAAEDPPLSLTSLISLSYLLSTALIATWIMLRHQVTPPHVGFTIRKTTKFIIIGLLAGFATLPFVMAVSAAVTVGSGQEYDHPILDAMKSEGSLSSFMLAVFSAVIAAPIAEEFLFRVLLQGWLQSIPFSTALSAVFGASEARRGNPQDSGFFHPASQVGESSTLDGEATSSSEAQQHEQAQPDTNAVDDFHRGRDANPENPYHVTTPTRPVELEVTTENQGGMLPASVPPIWPSIVTGTLFGFAHWGYGLSFIPLILFGIILGLLYRATHSIWPCILVHTMLNASSMFALGINVLLERATN